MDGVVDRCTSESAVYANHFYMQCGVQKLQGDAMLTRHDGVMTMKLLADNATTPEARTESLFGYDMSTASRTQCGVNERLARSSLLHFAPFDRLHEILSIMPRRRVDTPPPMSLTLIAVRHVNFPKPRSPFSPIRLDDVQSYTCRYSLYTFTLLRWLQRGLVQSGEPNSK